MERKTRQQEWLEAAAAQDGHYGAGIGLGTLLLIILLVAILF